MLSQLLLHAAEYDDGDIASPDTSTAADTLNLNRQALSTLQSHSSYRSFHTMGSTTSSALTSISVLAITKVAVRVCAGTLTPTKTSYWILVSPFATPTWAQASTLDWRESSCSTRPTPASNTVGSLSVRMLPHSVDASTGYPPMSLALELRLLSLPLRQPHNPLTAKGELWPMCGCARHSCRIRTSS